MMSDTARWFSRPKPFFSMEFGKDWLENYLDLQKKHGTFYVDD
jgi:hypothetical protein